MMKSWFNYFVFTLNPNSRKANYKSEHKQREKKKGKQNMCKQNRKGEAVYIKTIIPLAWKEYCRR